MGQYPANRFLLNTHSSLIFHQPKTNSLQSSITKRVTTSTSHFVKASKFLRTPPKKVWKSICKFSPKRQNVKVFMPTRHSIFRHCGKHWATPACCGFSKPSTKTKLSCRGLCLFLTACLIILTER